MAWWRRVTPTPPAARTPEEEIEAARAYKELEQAHFEADVALETVRIQGARKRHFKQVIEEIRMENHFVDLWKNDGVGA